MILVKLYSQVHTNIKIESPINSYSKKSKNIDFYSSLSSTKYSLKCKDFSSPVDLPRFFFLILMSVSFQLSCNEQSTSNIFVPKGKTKGENYLDKHRRIKNQRIEGFQAK